MNRIKKIGHLISSHKQLFFLGIFVFLTPLIMLGIDRGANYLNKKIGLSRILKIGASFNQEMAAVLEKTEAALNEGTIVEYIAKNDEIDAHLALHELAKKYNLTGMTAVNADGVALARLASSKRGDYVSQTTSWGRRAAAGEAVVGAGVGRGLPFIINAAVPIMKDGNVEGALYGAYIIDDTYARAFKQKYLKAGEEVAFYSRETGISGESFMNPDLEQILGFYFNKGSDWVQSAKSDPGGVRYHIDGGVYNIGNIPVSDLDKTAGGILIFFPVSYFWPWAICGMVGTLMFILLVIHIVRSHNKIICKGRICANGGLAAIILLAAALLLMIASHLVYSSFIRQRELALKNPPNVIYNSAIWLGPDADIFNLTEQQRINIQITTGGEAINAVQVSVKYDPELMRVDDVSMINSFCDQNTIVEKQIDNVNGEVRIACAKPNGFMGENATVAELSIQPLKLGEATIRFGEDTEVLANDGLGTNVLRTVTDGTYRIADLRTPNGNHVLPFSYTNPNSTRWYNQKKVHVSWPRLAGAEEYLYSFDQNPDTVPDGTLSTTATDVDLDAKTDGIYYFHVTPKMTVYETVPDSASGTSSGGQKEYNYHIAPRAENLLGQTTGLKIMVDVTPPRPPVIEASATEIGTDEIVRFSFSDQGDNMSGVQDGFYVQYEEGIWLPTSSKLNMPFLEKGKFTVGLRVFDKADNYSDSEIKITVR